MEEGGVKGIMDSFKEDIEKLVAEKLTDFKDALERTVAAVGIKMETRIINAENRTQQLVGRPQKPEQ